ncbi:Cob(I)alamin adenosyltransferase @ Cob(I)alamin adenosyltransferase, clustered with cobalamin synthesis [hydrothermal vent metagenome]|uniref:Cob(I)alamin adenosyltransferase @ Cob(I)alamin adenosyltransferase, clustered with cobalamin synthesis n=1 Tax=hydrothermal vent metagenome TaxID=652676 RepID=A0A3B0Y0T3_9ZZZZ
MPDTDREKKHKKRMQRKKEIIDSSIAKADEDRGVLLVHTGNGKGKSSSGFGMVARALGHGMRVGIVQFIKDSDSTGEERFFKQFEQVSYHVMGEGFTWETQDMQRDKEVAEIAWQQAARFLCDNSFDLILLDELNIALKSKLLEVETVIHDLQQRPHMQHVIVTGRGAISELTDIADTVTEMKLIKHAYKFGVRAQKGIEY